MKRALLSLIGMSFLSAHNLSAQNGLAQAIRLSTASFIAGQLPEIHGGGYKDRTPRLLIPTALEKTVEGQAIARLAVAGPRSADESAALAARLGGRVAAPQDTIAMVSGKPVGTMGVQVRIGDPRVVGDSAVIMFGLLSRSTAMRMLPGYENRYVVVLKRSKGTEWVVQSYGLANQDKVPAVMTPAAAASKGAPPSE